jgi:UDP-glucose 4-epimerase
MKRIAIPTLVKLTMDWIAHHSIDEMCAVAWRWQSNNPNG